jgi:hypothetical protein
MKPFPTVDPASAPSALSEHPDGPHPGVMAMIYVLLFLAGLVAVSAFVTRSSFPTPSSSQEAIVAYFQANRDPVRISAFLSFGGVIALAVFVASVASRLRFLGIRSAWADTALVAGMMTALDQTASHLSEWALTWPGIAHDAPLTLALFYLLFAFGGPGFSVPMGLFVGSISMVAVMRSLLPAWLVGIGFAIALIGVVSWLNLLVPAAPLVSLTIPLTRFPAFAWLVVAGFMLPKAHNWPNKRPKPAIVRQ